MTIKLYNSVISNIGFPNDPNNGRAIDDRGNDIDTVIIENCTFYNITSRIIRDDGGYIKYSSFKNNTAVNIGQHGITFGKTGTLSVQNNIFMNVGFLPVDDDEADINFIISVDSLNGVLPEITQSVSNSNNSYWNQTTSKEEYFNDTTKIIKIFNTTAQAYIEENSASGTIYQEEVAFTNPPPFPDSVVIYNMDPAYNVDDAPFWIEPEVPSSGEGGNGLYHLDVPYNFDYQNTIAFSGGTNGTSLGDNNWKASAEPSAIKDLSSLATSMTVFPNPVSSGSEISVSFNLNKVSDVRISLYNLTGEKVASVSYANILAGVNQASIKTENISSGLYMLHFETDTESQAVRVLID
jgi:hypothetical protein